VSPAPERTPIDFGRIVDGYPLTDLRACVPSGLAPVSLFTSILGGWDETYYVAPGGSFERSGLRRSYWQIKGQGFSQNPSRFYLVGRTLFELRYRNKLPEASLEILRDFYGWNQQPYPVQMNYLSFLIQRSHARLALNQGNWTVSVDMQTRLCHDDQNASLGEGCSGVVGNQNCADILGQLLINRTSSNPGANCSSGACYWFDPISRFGDVYHRSWRAGTVSLNFDRENNDGGMLCCEDARLSSGPCSCADLVELMHAPARPPRRVRNPSSQQSTYRYLMATENNQQWQLWLWRHDWSDKGLQFGNPAKRFSAFPWKYASTGTRFPRDTGLLTSLPRPLGCNR
jgi:hypothetical protein